MKDTELKALQPLIDDAYDACDKWLESDAVQQLKVALAQACMELPEDFSITLNCVLDVFDSNREHTLPLLQTGITASVGQLPYRCHGDSTDQRYLVNGNICAVPHDHCPSCWGSWDFKDRHRTCPSCGITLGEEVKILLDSDVCPRCERGKVTSNNPKCSKCGHEVDMTIVAWG